MAQEFASKLEPGKTRHGLVSHDEINPMQIGKQIPARLKGIAVDPRNITLGRQKLTQHDTDGNVIVHDDNVGILLRSNFFHAACKIRLA